MRKPRVLHIVAGDAYGGASRVIASVCAALVSDGCEVDVVTVEPRLARDLASAGVGVVSCIEIDRRIRPIRDVRAALAIASLIRKERYSIVHTHTSKGGAVGRIGAVIGRAPVVLHTLHNFAFGPESPALSKWLNGVVERILAWRTDEIFTVSSLLAAECRNLKVVPKRSLTVIPNGIPDMPVVTRDTQSKARTIPTVVYVGRLAAGKGVETLLAAAAEVREEIEFDLQLYGAGEAEPEFRELAVRSGLPPSIFKGFVVDVGSVLDRADIVVLPSLREGMSIALLEAMRAGTCAITSDISPNLEVLGVPPAGMTFKTGDARDLADAMRVVLVDADRRCELGRSARERFHQSFTEDRMTSGYVDAYRRLVER